VNLFQAFVAAKPWHPIVKDAMDRTLAHYRLHPNPDPPGTEESILETSSASNSEQRWSWLGPEILGKAARAYLGIDTLRVGLIQKGANEDRAYFFREQDRDLEKFGLTKRTNNGCCCNVAVVSDERAVAWSRFPGSGGTCEAN